VIASTLLMMPIAKVNTSTHPTINNLAMQRHSVVDLQIPTMSHGRIMSFNTRKALMILARSGISRTQQATNNSTKRHM